MLQSIKSMLAAEGFVAQEAVPRGYEPRAFELEYEVAGLHPSVAKAHDAVQLWLNDITHGEDARRRWLTLFGKSGCGKSHLLAAAAAHLRVELPPRSVQRWNWGRLLSCLLDGAHAGLFRQVADMPVLILDDVGCELIASEKAQSVMMRQLYDLLEARRQSWTLLASNLAPNDYPDPRIASRLFRHGNEVVDLSKAQDYAFAQYKRHIARECP